MGLIKLISNLDNYQKTSILGERTTKILRYTFVDNDNDALETKILDEAVATQFGIKLVHKKRGLLVESLRSKEVSNLGFENHDSAIEFYKKNFDAFIKDFEIEEKYLLREEEDNRPNNEIIIPNYGECNGVNAFPHFYQYNLKREIQFLLFNTVNPIILATMPTGAGKTVLAMEIITDLFRSYELIKQKKINIMWLVNSKPLAEQSLQSFQKLWNQKGDHGVIAERYFGKFDEIELSSKSKITFSTYSLLTSRIETKEVKELLKDCDFLVIDEVHASEARTYSDLISNYKNLNLDFKILGLTATPLRSDDSEFRSLKNMFNKYLTILDNSKDKDKSPIQYLVDLEFLSQVSFDILNMTDDQSSLSTYYKSMHNSVLNECRGIINRKENTIVFAKSKAHAVAISIYLSNNGIENGLIVGETPDQYRQLFLKKFKDKDINVLVNHQILSTGIDVPGMNSIIVLSDVNSPTLALQILGRAMRGPNNGGNKNNKIYLTPDNFKKLSEYKILESLVI